MTYKRQETEHGFFMMHPKLRGIWGNMKYRCNNKNAQGYKWYGGKGIKVSMTVKDLLFIWERDNASALKKPSIDRIDSSKDYTIENCRFVEMADNRAKALKKAHENRRLKKSTDDSTLTAHKG